MTDAAHAQEARIRQLEDERYQAMLDGDVETLGRLLSARLTYTHSNGDRDSKESYLQRVRDRYFVYRSVAHPVDRIEVLSGAALVFGEMHASAEIDGRAAEISSRALAVWAQDGEDWTLIAYQPTALRRG
ncbi:MAG TPA: nuclear transport factor 2 family protein [Streptosporangiaceae bacterium]